MHETLAGFNHAALDEPGGRTMADTTTLVLLELHELWRHGAASTATLSELWPSAVRALQWCVANANGTDGYALPQHLTNTCTLRRRPSQRRPARRAPPPAPRPALPF